MKFKIVGEHQMHHLLLVVHKEILLLSLVNRHNLQGLLLLYLQAEDLHHPQEEQVEAVAFHLQWFQRKFIFNKINNWIIIRCVFLLLKVKMGVGSKWIVTIVYDINFFDQIEIHIQ